MKLETDLQNRTLRFDGVSIVAPAEIPALFLAGVQPKDIRVRELNDDVQQFNQLVQDSDKLTLASQEPIQIRFDWLIPKELLEADLGQLVAEAFGQKVSSLQYSDAELAAAIERLNFEVQEIEARGMTQFFKTVIHVIRTFRANNVVWGVGRGSSCASYTLFILGLHVVDCIKFDVPASEFFHD